MWGEDFVKYLCVLIFIRSGNFWREIERIFCSVAIKWIGDWEETEGARERDRESKREIKNEDGKKPKKRVMMEKRRVRN